jgi:hypothetical protein
MNCKIWIHLYKLYSLWFNFVYEKKTLNSVICDHKIIINIYITNPRYTLRIKINFTCAFPSDPNNWSDDTKYSLGTRGTIWSSIKISVKGYGVTWSQPLPLYYYSHGNINIPLLLWTCAPIINLILAGN